MKPICELFLTQYYLLQAVLGEYITAKVLFLKFAKAFKVDESDALTLFHQGEQEAVKSVESVQSYYRHQRIKKYCDLMGMENDTQEEIEEHIALKGAALLLLEKEGFQLTASASTRCQMMIQNAEAGKMNSRRLFALALIEGIGMKKDYKRGMSVLADTAAWQDVASIILLRYFDDTNYWASDEHLNEAVKVTPYEDIIKTDRAALLEDRVLSRAFTLGVLRRDAFSRLHADVLFNRQIPIKTREKAVLSGDKDILMNTAQTSFGTAFGFGGMKK